PPRRSGHPPPVPRQNRRAILSQSYVSPFPLSLPPLTGEGKDRRTIRPTPLQNAPRSAALLKRRPPPAPGRRSPPPPPHPPGPAASNAPGHSCGTASPRWGHNLHSQL